MPPKKAPRKKLTADSIATVCCSMCKPLNKSLGTNDFVKCLTETLHSIVLVLDAKGKIVLFNSFFQTLTGYTLEEVKGKDYFNIFIPEEDRSKIRKLFTNAIVKNETKGSINPILTKEGKLIPIEWHDSTLCDSKGNVAGLLAMGHDITKRKKLEIKLTRSKEEAEAANKAKSKFMATMSHEIRTPLTGIMGFAELLQDESLGKLNASQKMFVEKILESSDYLLAILNDALDIAKVESGKTTLTITSFSLKKLLNDKVSYYRHRALKHNIKISSYISGDVKQIFADERMIKQIMHNLFSNALKFTPDDGKISIRAKRVAGNYVVAVSDSGIGIEKESLSKVFNSFSQIDTKGFTPRSRGTGLGLALVRKMATLHKGSIAVESEGKGEGTTFTLTLPIEATHE